jgi:hypothetical protein
MSFSLWPPSQCQPRKRNGNLTREGLGSGDLLFHGSQLNTFLMSDFGFSFLSRERKVKMGESESNLLENSMTGWYRARDDDDDSYREQKSGSERFRLRVPPSFCSFHISRKRDCRTSLSLSGFSAFSAPWSFPYLHANCVLHHFQYSIRCSWPTLIIKFSTSISWINHTFNLIRNRKGRRRNAPQSKP